MKTALDINDSLLATAKMVAARQRTSLTRLRAPQSAADAGKRTIPVSDGRGGLVPGLDPSSNKAMLDAADDDV